LQTKSYNKVIGKSKTDMKLSFQKDQQNRKYSNIRIYKVKTCFIASAISEKEKGKKMRARSHFVGQKAISIVIEQIRQTTM
jgi:hypothetical protein